MDRRGEYEIFLHNFRLRFGFLPPPNYEEWLFNISRSNYTRLPVEPRSIFHNPQSQYVSAGSNNTFYAISNQSAKRNDECIGTTSVKSRNEMGRAYWSFEEQEILVNTWRENFAQFETIFKNEAWNKVLSAVSMVGKKTLQQCKDKIKNLKELYKEAKDKNKTTGETLHKSPFFEIFDDVLGCRHAVTMPIVKEVGASNQTSATPTRLEVESLLKSGKKRKVSKTSKTTAEMQNFFKEAEEKHERFLENLMAKQMEEEKAEREKDRQLMMALFKKD